MASRRIPVTLEAPLIRESSSLNIFTELFREHGLGRWIIGINTLNNPMGNISADPIVVGHLIQSMLNIESIPHIVVSVENRYTLPRWLIGACILGINNLLILGGDVGIEGSISYSDALAVIRGFEEGSIVVDGQLYKTSPKKFYLGGVLIQNRSDEYKRVLYKLGQGICFFQTQVTFEPDRLLTVLRELDREYRGDKPIPILVSVVPYLNRRIMEVLGGGAIDSSLEKFGGMTDEEYVSHLTGVINSLLDYCEKLDSVKLGVHIIPIQWRSESASNTTLLLSNITG